MTDSQHRLDEPTGVFITGPTGFGKTYLAHEFALGAIDSGADVHVIDVSYGGSDYARLDAVTHTDLGGAVTCLRDLLGRVSPEQPTVVIIDDLATTLRREDRLSYVVEQDRLHVDRLNRLRDELGDLIADAFVFGERVSLFPVVITQNDQKTPFVSRVKQASTGWAHFEFTSSGKGTLRTERGSEPFHLTRRTADAS